jgi:hypothetical protein
MNTTPRLGGGHDFTSHLLEQIPLRSVPSLELLLPGVSGHTLLVV